jgi:hypothetical protein
MVPPDALNLGDEYAWDKVGLIWHFRSRFTSAEFYLSWAVNRELDEVSGTRACYAYDVSGLEIDDVAMLVSQIQCVDSEQRFVFPSRIRFELLEKLHDSVIEYARVFSVREAICKMVRAPSNREVTLFEGTVVGTLGDICAEYEGELVKRRTKVVNHIGDDTRHLWRERLGFSEFDDLLQAIRVEFRGNLINATIAPGFEARLELLDVFLSSIYF